MIEEEGKERRTPLDFEAQSAKRLRKLSTMVLSETRGL
jgi:hypothetical protein